MPLVQEILLDGSEQLREFYDELYRVLSNAKAGCARAEGMTSGGVLLAAHLLESETAVLEVMVAYKDDRIRSLYLVFLECALSWRNVEVAGTRLGRNAVYWQLVGDLEGLGLIPFNLAAEAFVAIRETEAQSSLLRLRDN